MESPAVLESFRSKRDALNATAHRLRDERDGLNEETRRRAGLRDELNAKVRALVEQANAHRATRDATNHDVRGAKALRDEWNRAAHEKAALLQELRREVGHRGNDVDPIRLRAEIRHLEYQQQTTVLSPKKEKDLIDLIGSKLKQLKDREKVVHESGEIKQAYEAMKAAKAQAEEAHATVTGFAAKAQAEHDAMITLFGQADELRKAADAEQAAFVRHKVQADKVHKEYIEAVSSIRDLDRVVQGIRGPGAPTRDERGAPTAAQRAEAEDIFEKFRKGEKLSTEDLIALQKGGRL